MWTPDKYEAKRAKKVLQVRQLTKDERHVMNAIVNAHQINGCLDWFDRATLLALEEKYKGQLAEL